MNAHSKVSVPFDPSAISYVTSIEDVRARHPAAMSRATGKVLSRLDKHCRAMIARATFVVIGTHGSKGADVSPRGDPAGFVRVLDDRYVLLPDRIGNNRFDSMENIFETGHIGMLFLVPGMAEVLRINGTRAHRPTMRRCSPAPPCRGGRRRSAYWSRCARPICTAPRRSTAPACGIRRGTSTATSCRAMARCWSTTARGFPRRRATGRAAEMAQARDVLTRLLASHHNIPSIEIT